MPDVPITVTILSTESKADIYRAKGARCQERAKTARNRRAREWQLTLARVYQVLASETESADQQPTESDTACHNYWSCWL
jgi:hypothetical protein